MICEETAVVNSPDEDPGGECSDLPRANARVAPDGPFKFQVQFGIRTEPDAEGNYEIGYAKVVLPVGRLPTREMISDAAVSVLGQLPEGYRFVTRQEFADMIAREATGCEQASMPMGGLTFKLDVFG